MLASSDDPPKVSASCELLIVATSADQVANAIRLAQPGPRNRVVVAGRGIDPHTGAWLTETVTANSPTLRVGALAGPAPVEEMLSGGLGSGVVASDFDEVRAMTTAALHSSRYRCYETTDLVGIQLAGAMMPVLASLLGLALHLGGSGVGMHGMVLARGLAEATRIGEAFGADPRTFIGLAGVGDLVAAQAEAGPPPLRRGQGDRGRAQAQVGRTRGLGAGAPAAGGRARLGDALVGRVGVPCLTGRRPSMR